MKRPDFPLISDVAFYSAASWFFLLGIMRYYRLPTVICIAVSTLLSLAVGVCVFLMLSYKRRRKLMGKKERESKDALMLHLALEKSERVRAELLTALLADGREVRLDGDALALDGVPTLPLFTMQPVSADAVAVLLREFGETPFVLACNALTPEAEALLASFGRKTIEGDEIYSLFERTHTVPERLICGEIPRKTARAKLARTFSKRNARPFFTSGLLLLFMSLFTFFPIYYLVTGSILLASSVLIRAIGTA